MAFNVMDLLGAMMSSNTGAGAGRMQNAAGNLESSLGGLGSLLGGGSASMSGGLQGLMGTLLGGGSSMINRAGQAVGGKDNLAAAGLGALIGALSGKSHSSSMGGIGGGLMGLLGMMAYKALTGSGSGNSSQQQQMQIAEHITSRSEQEVANDAEIILTAMIDAAKADGQVDAEELGRITGKIKSAGIGQDGMNYLISKLQSPMETNKILAATRGRPELAAQVYSASLMAIDVDTAAEKKYLASLANAMGLSANVINNIEQIVGMQKN